MSKTSSNNSDVLDLNNIGDGSVFSRVALSGGDLAVLPLGHAHVLRDHPRSAPVRFGDVARCDSRSAVLQLEVGAKGPETNLPDAR